jgi:hypothetical protein
MTRGCNLLLFLAMVPREGRTCSARFLPGPKYLAQGFFTVGTQSACQDSSYCPLYSPPMSPGQLPYRKKFWFKWSLVELGGGGGGG